MVVMVVKIIVVVMVMVVKIGVDERGARFHANAADEGRRRVMTVL